MSQTSRFTRGQLAELPAESALEEARIEVGRRLADPNDALHQMICGIAGSPGSPVAGLDLQLAPTVLPQTQAMLGSPEMAGASIDAGPEHVPTGARGYGTGADGDHAARAGAVHVMPGPIAFVPGSLVEIAVASVVGFMRLAIIMGAHADAAPHLLGLLP